MTDQGAESALKPLVIFTLHRRETLAAGGVADVVESVAKAALRLNLDVVFPMHPSPMLRDQLRGASSLEHIRCIEPPDYPEFVRLMRRAALIISDSGGIQEEATFLGIPVLCLRDTTERPEAVRAGAVHLAGSNPTDLEALISITLEKGSSHIDRFAFGDGRASERILGVLSGGA